MASVASCPREGGRYIKTAAPEFSFGVIAPDTQVGLKLGKAEFKQEVSTYDALLDSGDLCCDWHCATRSCAAKERFDVR
jgi:hypothetical protein